MTDKPIWMPVNVADYMKDTAHLSTLEDGAYWRLLMHCWTNDGVLFCDKKRLCRITKLTPRQWVQVGPIVLEFFTLVDGVYRHKRVDQELEKAGRFIAQKRAAGKASAAKRAQQPLNGRSTGVAIPLQREANQIQSQSQDTVTNVTDGGAVDHKFQVFRKGKQLLMADGCTEQQAGRLLGKWRKAATDEGLAKLISQAVEQGVSDPRAWLSAAVARPAHDQDAFVNSVIQRFGKQAAAAQ